jgi:hypothetical protein
VAPDATYVSLSYDDPELNRIMPWAGTKRGARDFVDNFKGVRAHWWNDSFEITDTIEQDGKVAIFGRFTLRSVTLNQAAESPSWCSQRSKTSGSLTSSTWRTRSPRPARSAKEALGRFALTRPPPNQYRCDACRYT